ncbi:gag/pol protein [Cucumis melo var. makuwa]|uniref:Gag/pol protein n=1 Tax=Cucumis melo var. makuwa TaxID=1194695 RepID=A0A5A7SSF3_CUCMM|nr:gag/pol protein [Cucumis melo var. makuwa]
MPRCSGRVVSQPNRYLGLTETYVVIPVDGVEDSLSNKQAMNDVDKDQWIKATDLEMGSMYFNSVWELVDLPEGVKPIRCKWIYKRKRDSAGKNSKKGLLPFRHGVHLSREQCPKTPQDVKHMRRIPYSSAMGSLMYVMLYTRPDICYAVGIVSRYKSNARLDHWTTVKIILKYLRRTRDYMLVYEAKDLILTGYTDSDFQTDKDSRKSTSESVFTLNRGAVIWCSIKQRCIADSTMEAEYIVACEAVWLRKFLHDLEVVPNMNLPITLYCDNRDCATKGCDRHQDRREHNIADPFMKTLTAKVFKGHLESLGLRDMYIR